MAEVRRPVSLNLPVGPIVPDAARVCLPEKKALCGQYIRLEPLSAVQHCDQLYEISHGSVDLESVWTYLFQGPFASKCQMRAWLQDIESRSDPMFFAAVNQRTKQVAGMLSIMNIDSRMRRLELGNIWYGKAFQRGVTNTEAVLLLLQYTFDTLCARRVEWKCDSLNERSRMAAIRLGFQFEGVFRQHMIVKGRNRDTCWYSMLDVEWARIEKFYRSWITEQTPESYRFSLMSVTAR